MFGVRGQGWNFIAARDVCRFVVICLVLLCVSSLLTCLFGLHVRHVNLHVYAYVHVHGMKHTYVHICLFTCIQGFEAWGITPGAIKTSSCKPAP